jgi:integrase
MADDLEYLTFKRGTWYVRVQVPPNVQAALGKKELTQTCKTGEQKAALRVRDPIVAKFKAMIERARLSGAASPKEPLARIALAAWAAKGQQYAFGLATETHTDYLLLHSVEAYQKAWEEPDGYLSIPGFDRAVARVLMEFGCDAKEGDPIVARMRQEAALTFAFALQARERARLSYAFTERSKAVLTEDLEGVARFPAAPEKVLPAPSKRLSEVYAAWIAWKKPSAKDRPNLDNQYRRLIEFFGDRPANHLQGPEVTEYIRLIPRLPASKRTKEQAKMTVRELAAIDHPKTLTAKTVGRWFASHKAMFAFATSNHLTEINPFANIEAKYVVTGRPSTEKRAFTPEELASIFSAPIFHGHDGSDAHRSKPGKILEKDGFYWLPILSFLTGGRQAECANMRLDEVKNLGKTYFFDLSGRQVGTGDTDSIKNDQSKRQIPFHPRLRELGFVDYVEVRRANPGDGWLFPDLAHDTVSGAATQFSRWWAVWMDKHGLPSPEINHHSWRHAFIRYARSSPVKKELHDILTGHEPLTTSEKYGKGAPIEVLARQMARIKIPLPKLP